MKKITLRRRMLSLTLAASVALPQASSAFAASLWNEDGENDRITQAIESRAPDARENAMPWVTLPSDDKNDQPTQVTVEPSAGASYEGDGILLEGDHPEPPATARDDKTTNTPGTGLEGLASSADGVTPPTAGSNPDPTVTRPASEVTTPVTTPVITPEDTPRTDPEPTPEMGPDRAENARPDGEEGTALSTDKTAGGEELTPTKEGVSTAPATEVAGADFALPYSSPAGVSLSQWMSYRLGYGVEIRNYTVSLGLSELDSHFAVETTESRYQYGYRDYGSGLNGPNPSPNPEGPKILPDEIEGVGGKDEEIAEGVQLYDRYSICVFPSEEALGRVPDQQFVGWYVYPSGAKANQSGTDARSWTYNDPYSVPGVKREVITYPYEEGDPYYNVSTDYTGRGVNKKIGDLGNTWDGGIDYDYGYHVERDEEGRITLQYNVLGYDDYDDSGSYYGYCSPVFGDGENNPVSIVGRWEASDESRASGIRLTAEIDGKETELPLYTADISGTYVDGTGAAGFAQKENGAAQEYWLRVPANVDSLSLDLSTLELYYNDYVTTNQDVYSSYKLDTEKSHVQVTAAFGGVTTSYTGDLSARMLPAWTVNDYGVVLPQNTRDDKAHSEWSVSGIALQSTTGGSLYNDITVTVTSPSGDVTTTYVFHVQRLTEPTLTRSSGNTPLGMIYRDAASGGAIGSSGTGDSVGVAEEKFTANRQFTSVAGTYPSGSANQNGTIFRDPYTANAWPTDNDVDLDRTAIVVYQDSIFRDPGVTLTDSEGKTVNITRGNVSRSLMLRQVDALNVKQIGAADVGTVCWYRAGGLLSEDDPLLMQDGAFSNDLTFETISEQNGTDSIDLRGKNILPGIYTIEYRYYDPVSGKTYGSDSTYVTEAGQAGAAAFRRTLVVLPTPGDVDMDGAVTMADALALQSVLGEMGGYTTVNGEIIKTAATVENRVESNDLVSLFAYRVCDVNHDGVLNSADVALLRTLPNPKTTNETNRRNSDYYYIPLPTGVSGERYPRQSLTVDGTGSGAGVEMVYLGKEGGTPLSGGATSEPTGPWALVASGGDAAKSGVEIGDTFWMGVKLVNPEKLEDLQSVKSLTFTLTYDSRYLEPAVVLNATDWEELVRGAESESTAVQTQMRWEGMMRLYNLESGAWSGDKKMTVWAPGSSDAYQEDYRLTDAAGAGLRFTTHYSTARIPLESVQSGSVTDDARLKSVTFSVELQSGKTPIRLQELGDGEEGYLFAVPFRLIRHPFGLEEAQLVEFEAGMRSFTLVGVGEGGVNSLGTTYAYSAQDTIYGGTTRDLSKYLTYRNQGAKLPLGEDRSEIYQIYNYNHDGITNDSNSTVNGVYAAAFVSRSAHTASGANQLLPTEGEITGNWPAGLKFSSGEITGIPQKAGEYEFYIGNTPYRLVIDKADLHFWAVNQSSYYGQTEFRGTASPDFTFRYATEDICSFELDRVADSGGTIRADGDGSGLGALLADSVYSNPTFTAVTRTGDRTAVSYSTAVGTYDITNTLCPESTNYNFIYTPTRAGAGGGLTILARPIKIVHINSPAEVGQVFSDQPGALNNLIAQQGTDVPVDAKTFTVRLASTSGIFEGRPLTENESVHYTDGVILPGDLLRITYAADYIRNEADIEAYGQNSNLFYLTEMEEYRSVRVGEIRLTGGTRYENYRLVDGEADEPVTEGVVGKVLLRQTKELRISQLPILTYQYGNRFSQSNELHFFILKDGEVREGEYRYSDSAVKQLGVDAYWATPEEREAYLNHDVDYEYGEDRINLETDQLFTMDFNGRYLCLAAKTIVDGVTVTIRSYAEEPLVVTKRPMTLTAKPGHRYYGEENGTLTFTYDPAQLASIDWREGLTGAAEELLVILAEDNYREPTLKAVVRAPDSPEGLESMTELTPETDYTGNINRVVIWGASSDNYQFNYSFTGSEGPATIREGYGASTYQIERRPIVVESIIKGANEPLAKLYADTRVIYTHNLTLGMDEVKLVLPDQDEQGHAHYFQPQASSENWQDIGFSVSDAVVNNDQISFTYTATVIPTDGSEYMKYTDFSRGYFNMTDAENGYRDYPVQVSNLRLVGDDANNYTLVYKRSDRGVWETVDKIVSTSGISPEVSYNTTYYAAQTTANGQAIGRVYLRPIDQIEIRSAGRMNYIYGDTYDPTRGDTTGQNRQALTIRIHYVNDPSINNYAGNVIEEEVAFRMAGRDANGEMTTTFDNRALKIYYVKENQTSAQAIANGQELELEDALYVEEHTGAKLVVTGQRGEQTTPIVSLPTTSTLQITPKVLTLTAEDQHRVYGEENPKEFGFTFRASDLARWDRALLGLSDTDEKGGSELARLDALTQGSGYQHVAYVEPTFGTDATPGSDVLNGGQAGYAISNRSEGSLENYTFQYTPGTLYVYPRPVKISRFNSDGANPIYTIFSDMGSKVFFTNVPNVEGKEDGTTWTWFELSRNTSGIYRTADGRELPVSNFGLYPGDEMLLRVQVVYPSDVELDKTDSQTNIKVTVQDASLVAGSPAASNYVLETTGGTTTNKVALIDNREAIGKVELRNIVDIEITQYPRELTYTYGEILKLAGLEVTIHYNRGSAAGTGGTGQTQVVPYIGPDQFAQYGLHVYYYDSATWNEEDDRDAIGKENGIILREAATGDHLTIAPTHDTQLKSRNDSFAANGKYLLVTAQRHTDHATTTMLVQTPIKVNPLPITFTLSAEDKIYDGNTQAAGTITFTNIFSESDVAVDAYNLNGVTDVVYPVIGADYEAAWNTPMGNKRKETFENFKEYVAQYGYSFSTGSYVANDPSILTENKTLNWTAGYSYDANGVMKFSYLDPNVAYAQTPTYDNYGSLATKMVQVTGLRLAGPDAANYTLVGQRAGETVEVTTGNVDTAQGYLGTGLPTATIHKANRAAITDELLPQVEIDPHTNVVRIIYDQNTSAIAGQEERAYLDELHFEFALQQVVTTDVTTPEPTPEEPGGETEDGEETGTQTLSEETGVTITDIIQWAGQNGNSTWADPRYFGGEAAPMSHMPITSEDPEAGEYVPREDDIPKADSITETTTIKGQVYQWIELDDGFTLDLSAYPGGEPWPGYELYTTDRAALERDGVYLAVIRAAETHNYNASPALSSVEGYTPDLIQAILEAKQAVASDTTGAAQARLDAAIQAASEPLERAVLEARQAAQDEVDALMGAGEKDGKLEERPVREAAPAVKTYKQVIETVSLKELQSEGAANGAEPYQVPTLEAVWFTDVEEIPSKEVLDAVVWNTDPVRYRTYAWDENFTAELTFKEEDEPISLRTPFDVTVTDRREDGGEESESTLTVNMANNARLYVDITFPSNSQTIKPEQIVLRPGGIMAVLGDKPVELGVTLYPARARAAKILWTSSDPNVAVVDERGWVTFLGVGTAVITATVPNTYLGAPPLCSTSITVTVVENWEEEYPDSIFDFGNMGSFLLSDTGDGESGDKFFLPEENITRGEVANLLVQFYVENPTWSKLGPTDFPDLTGEEDYAEAARLLGSLGVFLGYQEGHFGGDQDISRAEFVVLLARMTALEVVDTAGQPHAFLDIGEEDTWAYSEIDALCREGILLGVGDGYFEPGRYITRSEVAAMLTRLLRFPLGEAEELIIPVDVAEDHWARDSILRAVNGSQVLEESLVVEAP